MTESPKNNKPNNNQSKTKQVKPLPERKQLPNVGPAAETNKYAPKERIGTPTLGREKAYVTRVGLGNLETITYGNTNVQP
jgi:hypothetical protein